VTKVRKSVGSIQ